MLVIVMTMTQRKMELMVLIVPGMAGYLVVKVLVSILQLKNASSKLDLSRLYYPLAHVRLQSIPFPQESL